MIKAVFFDLGWSLVKPSSGDWTFTELFFQMYPEMHLDDVRTDRFQKSFARAYQPLMENPLMKDVDEQIRRYRVFFETFLADYGLTYTDEIVTRLAEDISTNDANMKLLDHAEETLRYLKEQGFHLGIISDTWPNIITQLDALHISQYFDHKTYSFQIGTNKPSPMMFQDALDHCKYLPRECVFVEDIPANLEAAEKFHINAVQSIANPHCAKDERFPSIRHPGELIQLLER
jgi:HAD superfamily hydrolase (TIGR01509 family)